MYAGSGVTQARHKAGPSLHESSARNGVTRQALKSGVTPTAAKPNPLPPMRTAEKYDVWRDPPCTSPVLSSVTPAMYAKGSSGINQWLTQEDGLAIMPSSKLSPRQDPMTKGPTPRTCFAHLSYDSAAMPIKTATAPAGTEARRARAKPLTRSTDPSIAAPPALAR